MEVQVYYNYYYYYYHFRKNVIVPGADKWLFTITSHRGSVL